MTAAHRDAEAGHGSDVTSTDEVPCEREDVIVIGAGPAGAVSALLLARAGIPVRVVERKVFPRSKVCGSCLSESAVKAIEAIGAGHVLRSAVPLKAFRLAARGRWAEVPLHGGCVLSRSALDTALMEEAVRAGAVFQDGVSADVGPADGSGRRVTLQSVRDDAHRVVLNAKVVIFAAGLAGSAFRHDAGLRSQSAPQALIGASALSATAGDFDRFGTIFMAAHRAGYVGLTRTETGSLNIAAAIQPDFVAQHHGLGSAAGVIVREAGFSDEVIADLKWTGTPPLTRRPTSVAAERIFLVGDAAGYVEPFTGEGIGWAVAAARAVAPIAAEAVQAWSPAHADRWSSQYARTIGRRQRLCRALTRGLRSRSLVAAAIRILQPFPQAAAPVLRQLAAS